MQLDAQRRLAETLGRGRIRGVGYYIRDGTVSSAAYWITDSIVYLTDYSEGFDILRISER